MIPVTVYDFRYYFDNHCVLYYRHSPFRSQNKSDIDQVTLTKEPHIPSSFSPEVAGLIKGLLEKDPKDRLGCKGRGYVIVIKGIGYVNRGYM